MQATWAYLWRSCLILYWEVSTCVFSLTNFKTCSGIIQSEAERHRLSLIRYTSLSWYLSSTDILICMLCVYLENPRLYSQEEYWPSSRSFLFLSLFIDSSALGFQREISYDMGSSSPSCGATTMHVFPQSHWINESRNYISFIETFGIQRTSGTPLV